MARASALTGAAGTYFVASRLAHQGLPAAVTHGNAPFVDILVSLPDGAAAVSLQVKTTESALRKRGRGPNKVDHHYEWDLGRKAATTARDDLFVAFVDLKKYDEMPDVYIIPSSVLKKRYEGRNLKRWRYHPLLEEIKPYLNNWDLVRDRLHELAS